MWKIIKNKVLHIIIFLKNILNFYIDFCFKNQRWENWFKNCYKKLLLLLLLLFCVFFWEKKKQGKCNVLRLGRQANRTLMVSPEWNPEWETRGETRNMVTVFNSVYRNAYVYINKAVMGFTIHLPASIFITFPS